MVVSACANTNYSLLPISVDILVRFLVAYIDVLSSRASALFGAIAILKDLMKTIPRSDGVGNYQLKHIQDTIMTQFFLRENKHKLLFFELNSSRLDTLMNINRMSLIMNYSTLFGLEVTAQPSNSMRLLQGKDVQLLYHASLVELFSKCFDDCCDLNYLRCLTFETIMTVLQTMESYNCPPLVYAYGLFLHNVFLKGNSSPDYITKIDTGEKTSLDISMDDRLHDVLSKLCAAAMAPESLHNNYRSLIFDVTIPCITSYLQQAAAIANTEHPTSGNRLDPIFKMASQLFDHLLENRKSLLRDELMQLASAWQDLRLPISSSQMQAYADAYDACSTSPTNKIEANTRHEVKEGQVEMTERTRRGGVSHVECDTKAHVSSLLEHCPTIDQV